LTQKLRLQSVKAPRRPRSAQRRAVALLQRHAHRTLLDDPDDRELATRHRARGRLGKVHDRRAFRATGAEGVTIGGRHPATARPAPQSTQLTVHDPDGVTARLALVRFVFKLPPVLVISVFPAARLTTCEPFRSVQNRTVRPSAPTSVGGACDE
jgi:hypothetical protein